MSALLCVAALSEHLGDWVLGLGDVFYIVRSQMFIYTKFLFVTTSVQQKQTNFSHDSSGPPGW
jgi:hypothetical protein